MMIKVVFGKETEKANPFNMDYGPHAKCLKDAIDQEILEKIYKSVKKDDQRNHIHSQSDSQSS